jgi:protein SCO1/2
MKSAAVRYWVTMLVLCAGFYGGLKGWQHFQSADFRSASAAEKDARETKAHAAPTIGDLDKTVQPFELTDQAGEPFKSDKLQGKVWVASFFFTNCPGTCWRLNQAVSNLQGELDDEVRLISITCDPKNDTPEALAKYANHFKAEPQRWTFLTGDLKAIQKVGQESFLVAVQEGVHSERAMVVDRAGKVRASFNMLDADQIAKLKKKVGELLAEPAPAKS